MEDIHFTTTMNAVAILLIVVADIISIRARMVKGRVTQGDLVAQLLFIIPALFWSICSLLYQFITTP